MGQGIACAHRISDGAFIYGSEFHSNIMLAWGHNSSDDGAGWICSETRLDNGPGKYTLGSYGYFQDPVLGEKCRKQAVDFFEKHTASVDSVVRYLRNNRRYCGTHLQPELLFLLEPGARGIFTTMQNVLNKRNDIKWKPEGKGFDKKINKTARDMESAIKGLIISINKNIHKVEYKLPMTSCTVAIRDALYLAASKKVINHKIVSDFEVSMKALVTYYDDILRQISQEKNTSRRNAGGENTFLSELDIFESLVRNDSTRSMFWKPNSALGSLQQHQLYLSNGDIPPIKLSSGWKLEDEYGRCFLFATSGDKNCLSINSGAIIYEMGEDGFGYPTLLFRRRG